MSGYRERLPDYFEGALDILQFSGTEKLFAIDGQHRVVGIKRAAEKSVTLGDEEVIVLFVPRFSYRSRRVLVKELFSRRKKVTRRPDTREFIPVQPTRMVRKVLQRDRSYRGDYFFELDFRGVLGQSSHKICRKRGCGFLAKLEFLLNFPQ